MNWSSRIKEYRAWKGLNQAELASALGVGQSYISKIENGTNTPQNTNFINKLESLLSEYPLDTFDRRLVGLEEDWVNSILRLAKIARDSGHASECLSELRAVVQYLDKENKSTVFDADKIDFYKAQCESLYGLALGDILPKSKLSQSIAVLEKSYERLLRQNKFGAISAALKILGNEYRKNGNYKKSRDALEKSVKLATNDLERGAALLCLARLSGCTRDEQCFVNSIRKVEKLYEKSGLSTPTFNEISIKEVSVRAKQSFRKLRLHDIEEIQNLQGFNISPQWSVIREISIGDALLFIGESEQGKVHLEAGVKLARILNLPQQYSRASDLLQKISVEL